MPRRFVALVLLVSLLAAGVTPLSAQPDSPSEIAYTEVLPAHQDEIRAATEEWISRYVMDVSVDPAAGTLAGDFAVTFVNATGEPLSDVYFRLYPNAFYYGDGSLTVADITRDGASVSGELLVDDTVLRVPLADDLPPGERVDIAFGFTTVVPANSQGSYGIFSRATATNTWVLADWHPIVAGYDPAPGIGWRLDAPTSFGDPTYSDSSLYDVTLAAPEGWRVITTGVAIAEPTPTATLSDGTAMATARYVGGPARDFTMVLDDDYVLTTREVGETTVRMWANPGREEPLLAALDVAVSALEVYQDRLGPYPFAELDLADTPLVSGALGVAWANVIFLDSFSLANRLGDEDFYDFLLAHEVAHLWWAHMVGMNSNDHTFLVEGLTNHTMMLYVEWTRGHDAAEAMLRQYIAGPYINLLQRSGDQIADLPIAEGQVGRSAIFYGKGALGFLAIQLQIGDEAFLNALQTLARWDTEAGGSAFQIASPSDVRAAFEQASGQDLTELWRLWFEVAETTPEDVIDLLEAYERRGRM